MKISIIGRPKSKAINRIIKTTSIRRFSTKCDVVINYGLAGKRLKTFNSIHQLIQNKPMINKYIGCTKYKAVIDAEKEEIIVPKTLLSLGNKYECSNFLIKKMHSQGGIGIAKAKTKRRLKNKYYQEFIQERVYELRVHAFSWLDKSEWCIQKRLGSNNVIAWNYHNGGTFQTIKHPDKYVLFNKAKDIAEKVLKIRNMSFGAVDFVVTSDRIILFLEINSAPGFTELSENTYTNAFNPLSMLSEQNILRYCN